MEHLRRLLLNIAEEFWKTIYRILKPNSKPIPEWKTGVAERLTSSKRTTIEDLNVMINELSRLNENAFKLQPTSYNDVRKALNTIRSDFSTGHDSIPINLLKPVSEYIISPLTFIINNFISSGTFPEYWKVARISPVPRVNILLHWVTFGLYQFCQCYQKFMRE